MTDEQYGALIEAKLADGDFLNHINGYYEGALTKDNARDLVERYLSETVQEFDLTFEPKRKPR